MQFDHLVGQELGRGSFTWDADRTLLYAVGVGAGAEDPADELQFTTENTQGVDQQVIPTFLTQMSVKSDWINRLGFRTKQWNGKDWSCRALLKGCCDGDVGRFGGIEGRFSRPVYPGDRLDTLIWQDADGARFRTMANGERVVFDRGMFRNAGARSS